MIDLDRISKLTGFVDKLIQLKGIEDALDEEKISELIQDAINYSHADYSGEEIEAAKHPISILGGNVNRQIEFILPGSDIYRNLVVIDKVHETPKKYPRKAGLPAKEPLI